MSTDLSQILQIGHDDVGQASHIRMNWLRSQVDQKTVIFRM
jgi:hypothetical protein